MVPIPHRPTGRQWLRAFVSASPSWKACAFGSATPSRRPLAFSSASTNWTASSQAAAARASRFRTTAPATRPYPPRLRLQRESTFPQVVPHFLRRSRMTTDRVLPRRQLRSTTTWSIRVTTARCTSLTRRLRSGCPGQLPRILTAIPPLLHHLLHHPLPTASRRRRRSPRSRRRRARQDLRR